MKYSTLKTVIFASYWVSPLVQFSKFKNFLWVCWFLCKNLSNFVSLPENLRNRYYHWCSNNKRSFKEEYFGLPWPKIGVKYQWPSWPCFDNPMQYSNLVSCQDWFWKGFCRISVFPLYWRNCLSTYHANITSYSESIFVHKAQ